MTGQKGQAGIGIHNPKMGTGGAFDETYARNLGANNYVQFATILGMTRPPMSPLRRPLRRNENIEHHALANPEELEDLNQELWEVQSIMLGDFLWATELRINHLVRV